MFRRAFLRSLLAVVAVAKTAFIAIPHFGPRTFRVKTLEEFNNAIRESDYGDTILLESKIGPVVFPQRGPKPGVDWSDPEQQTDYRNFIHVSSKPIRVQQR